MTAPLAPGKASAPFRVHFVGYIEQTHDELLDNVRANSCYPTVERAPPHSRPLAIVGSGPSLAQSVELLKTWPGDIWSINLAGAWLARHGVSSTLYSVDASADPDNMSPPSTVLGAIFSSWCAPYVVGRYPDVRVFHMRPVVPDGILGGTTSAVSAPLLALRLGYQSVTFFGCESSYIDSDHVDRHERRPDEMVVRANGKSYRTQPPLYIQAQELSRIIREFPQVFNEQSKGLLRAMIEDDEWEVTQVSPSLAAHFAEVNEKGFEAVAKQYEGRM